MFKSKRSRLEAQLRVVEQRIGHLQQEVDGGVVPEPTSRLDDLLGPEGRKARLKTALWLTTEQGERLQLLLEQSEAHRFAHFKALVGDSFQFVVAMGVLRWLLRMSWSASVAVALVITVVFGLLYEIGKNSKRILEMLVLERAERIAKQESISLVEALRQVEDLKWP